MALLPVFHASVDITVNEPPQSLYYKEVRHTL